MFFGGGFMWIFWILLILITVFLIRSIISNGPSSRPPESPKDILKRRLANGEISKEEYKQLKNEIES
jgi:putative membrane protein